MRVLNLSKSISVPQSLVMRYQRFSFPAGEEHIKIEQEDQYILNKVIIASNMVTSSDIMTTFLATDAIRKMFPKISVELLAPYFPYARQDRYMVNGEPLSIKVISNLVNTMNYTTVHVLDPHSDVTSALVNNIKIIDNFPFINMVYKNIDCTSKYKVCVVSPDAGFEKKLSKIVTKMNIDGNNIIYGTKKRDVSTGKLSGFGFNGDVNNKTCLILDDICDSGGTFIGLAQKLREGGAKQIHLAISHGIFSKGVEHLLDNGIDYVYTTDSCFSSSKTDYKNRFNVLRINEFNNIFKD